MIDKKLTSTDKPKIWVISDTHLISQDLYLDGPAFQKMRDTAAGKDLDHQEYALTALVRKAIVDKPDAIVITGDLTFNGELKSAERLAEIFQPLTEHGITLLPVPGNHDINDGWAREFSQERQYLTKQISPEDWKRIFSASYDKAYHEDDSSLSYSVLLNDNYRLILMDSCIYGEQASTSAPNTNGRLSEAEFAWLEDELLDAQRQNQRVVYFMHHNLYAHHKMVYRGFVLDNADRLQELFAKYQVKLAFTGHIHAQSIAGPMNDCPAVDIATGAYSVAETNYGEASFSPEGIDYQYQTIEITDYLTGDEKKKLGIDNFNDYLRQVFKETDNAQNSTKHFAPADALKVQEFMFKMNYNYFVGMSLYSKTEKKQLATSRPYHLLVEARSGMKNYFAEFWQIEQDSRKLQVRY